MILQHQCGLNEFIRFIPTEKCVAFKIITRRLVFAFCAGMRQRHAQNHELILQSRLSPGLLWGLGLPGLVDKLMPSQC